MQHIYKELEVKMKNLSLLNIFCFESNSDYAVNGVASKIRFKSAARERMESHIDLNLYGQTSMTLPYIYWELTAIGRSYRSLRHSSKHRPVIQPRRNAAFRRVQCYIGDLAGSNTLMQNASLCNPNLIRIF
jgi:hypothetical protein